MARTTITNAQVEVSSIASPDEPTSATSPSTAAMTTIPPSSTMNDDNEMKIVEENSFNPTNLNAWDEIAKQLSRTKQFLTNYSTIFVLGNQSAGKTTLIHTFLEKSENPKPTLALDYSFARLRTSDKKCVCHIWELGGDAKKFSDLIETPIITNESLASMAIFLVLDLEKPEAMWPALESTISQCKKAFKVALASMDKSSAVSLSQILDEKLTNRIADSVQDKDYLEPFPLPLVIIGAKYDMFEKFEPEKRKTICRILRLVSHRLGASLNFFTKNDISLNRRARELFSHYAFETQFPKGISQDMNKPLMIPHGADSYEQINPGVQRSQFTLEYCRHIYESKIGKSQEKENIKNDPALDPNFREPEIDRKRAAAVQELSGGIRIRAE